MRIRCSTAASCGSLAARAVISRPVDYDAQRHPGRLLDRIELKHRLHARPVSGPVALSHCGRGGEASRRAGGAESQGFPVGPEPALVKCHDERFRNHNRQHAAGGNDGALWAGAGMERRWPGPWSSSDIPHGAWSAVGPKGHGKQPPPAARRTFFQTATRSTFSHTLVRAPDRAGGALRVSRRAEHRLDVRRQAPQRAERHEIRRAAASCSPTRIRVCEGTVRPAGTANQRLST